MKISELKQPYRAIAEADYLEQNPKNISLLYITYLSGFQWLETCAGHVYYALLAKGIYPPITDKIRKDYADVFTKLGTQPEWIPVKGEMVEVSNDNLGWFEREFVHDLGREFHCRYSVVCNYVYENRLKSINLYPYIRRIAPVTELTHDQIKAAMGIKGNIKIVE